MTRKQNTTAHASASRRRSARKKPRSKQRTRWRTAATSDRHDLYERSVQEPGAECEFVEQVWKEQRSGKARRAPRSIREDFCGTAAVCMEWVQRHRANSAVGVDLDQSVLDWGRRRMQRKLKPAQLRRVRLVRDDVLNGAVRGIDTVMAMNFSHFIFQTRDELRRYYRSVLRSLAPDGIFILDAYGGSESFSEQQEERDLDGFTYVWDQHHYNPITNHVVNHIHFKFPDGTRMMKAFTYNWRLWTLPELQELLLEAGFRKVAVYWEGTDEKTGEGNGEWAETRLGEACLGWIACLAAMK